MIFRRALGLGVQVVTSEIEKVQDDAVHRQKPFGRTGVAISLDQDVDHVPVLIHGAP